jgi:hypothetical protein
MFTYLHKMNIFIAYLYPAKCTNKELLQAKVALFKGYCIIDQQMICCNII